MGERTGAEVGLTGSDQIRVALDTMVANDGVAQMGQIHEAVQAVMSPHILSKQGKSSLRFFVNTVAVDAGFVAPHDKAKPGWHITAEGREYLKTEAGLVGDVDEEVTDDEGQEVKVPSNAVLAYAFEKYVLDMMRRTYPEYAWYHQGVHKKNERGLDLLATRLRPEQGQPRVVGVQVKLHAAQNAPSEKEWLKFLAGCFARRVNLGIFVTTGRLTGGQRREAAEAQVAVIEGYEELNRLAGQVGLPPFDAPENNSVDDGDDA